MVTAGCEVEHQTPPERPESAWGRDVIMCQPASHHVWLAARRRSPDKSVYIIDRMKNRQMQSIHSDTMGARACVRLSPLMKPSEYALKINLEINKTCYKCLINAVGDITIVHILSKCHRLKGRQVQPCPVGGGGVMT